MCGVQTMQRSTAACSTEELSEHCKKVDARHEHSHDIQTCQVKIKQLHKNEDKQKLFWISRQWHCIHQYHICWKFSKEQLNEYHVS